MRIIAQFLMSRPTERTFNAGAIRTEGVALGAGESHPPEKPTEPAPSPPAPHEGSPPADVSSFDTYRKSMADRVKVAETRRADAEDIIISAALLAATVAVFTGASVPGLKPDPRETSAFYLAKASQIFANASGVEINLPYMPPDPAEFAPSRPAVWVNSFWFMSLALSLSCILLASSLQRWALRSGSTALNSADQRDEMRVTWLSTILPATLRIATFFFYAGLGVLIFDSLRSYLGIWLALFLSATSIVGPVILLLETT
ncbi:hypothetical protein EI94DRAFT_822627 [Lactarius quietus]|nr:hypothetical protein EI94DRAFT_822627 [Lactarius quietus]